MNLYNLEIDEQNGLEQPLDLLDENLFYSSNDQNYEIESLEQPLEVESLNTFDGYLQEEPVLYFNYVEEAPKKKSKPMVRKSKKIKKSDTETEISSIRKTTPVLSNDIAKLQQCQMLKTIISQMENILQQTRTQILGEFIKKQQNKN